MSRGEGFFLGIREKGWMRRGKAGPAGGLVGGGRRSWQLFGKQLEGEKKMLTLLWDYMDGEQRSLPHPRNFLEGDRRNQLVPGDI